MKRFDKRWAGLLIVLPILILAPLYTANSPPTSLDLLTANLQQNRPLQALYHLDTLASESGWTLDMASRAGDLWLGLGDLEQAVTYWQVAIRLNPADSALARLLAQAYLDLQRWSEATIALNQLIELVPEDDWAHYHLGILQVAFTQYRAAKHLEIARQNPIYQGVADALLSVSVEEPTERAMQIGVVLINHNLWGVAEMVFQYAAVMGDPFPEALAYAGLARDYQGKSGREQIEQALTIVPKNAQVNYLLGLHLRLVNDDEGSLASFQRAIALNPVNPAYAAELGAAYQRLGDFAQAEYWLLEAVTLSGDADQFQQLLDQFYAQMPTIGN